MERIRKWEWDPMFYPAMAMGSIHILMLKTFRPKEEIGEAIFKRMALIPLLLEEGKENLKNCPALFLKRACGMLERGPDFIDFINKVYSDFSPSLHRDLEKNSEKVKKSFHNFKTFITEEITPAEEEFFPAGKEIFQLLLRVDFSLDKDIEEILETGKESILNTTRKLETLAENIAPGKGWHEIYKKLKEETPPPSEILSMYKNYIDESRDFVIKNELLTLPDDEVLEISETPDYIKSIITIAGYMSPGPYDKVQKGIFWVTPEGGKIHNIHTARTLTLHEAYPGHHIQRCILNKQKSSLLKETSSSITLEGWALYCEELMKETGYLNTPELLLVHEVNQLMRAVRVLIDVGLHTQNMTLRESADLLVDKVLMSPELARAEVEAYPALPTQPLSYTTGQVEILRLRKDYKKLKGNDFTLKSFHDELLSCGSVPVKLLRHMMLGDVSD